MARVFVGSSSEYGEYAGAVVSTLPYTLFGWFRVTDRTVSQALFSVGTSGGVARFQLATASNGSANCSVTNTGGTGANSSTGANAITNDTWFALGGVFTSTTSRTCYFNGTAQAANTTNITVSGVDRTTIGARWSTTLGAFLTGMAAECAVWGGVALGAAEMAALGKGFSPLCIRRDSLAFYCRLLGRASPEPDLINGLNLTLSGTANADHPKIIMPASRRLYVPGAVGATAYPWPYYQMMGA